MRRRDFIKGLAAVGWPLTARAQSARLPNVGVLLPYGNERDPRAQAIWQPFKQRLQELGWIDSRNIRFEYRLTAKMPKASAVGAKELVAAAPNVIVAFTNLEVPAVQQATQTIPIVFVLVTDRVGSGFVKSLARPDKNVTGFQNFETETGGKWLQLLRRSRPGFAMSGLSTIKTSPQMLS